MKVKFLSNVAHGADSYAPGDAGDLPAEDAQALIACGAAEAVEAKPKADAKAHG